MGFFTRGLDLKGHYKLRIDTISASPMIPYHMHLFDITILNSKINKHQVKPTQTDECMRHELILAYLYADIFH